MDGLRLTSVHPMAWLLAVIMEQRNVDKGNARWLETRASRQHFTPADTAGQV